MKEESAKTINQLKMIVEEEEVVKPNAKFIRAKHGRDLYNIGKTKMIQIARDAGAAYKIDGTLLINKEVFEAYLDTFKIPPEEGIWD